MLNRVRAGRIFFLDPVAEKIIRLGNWFSPNFGIFKVQGGCPMEKYSSTLGLQPKKSVEFLGDLQRDKQDLGHWNFTQRCLPPWSQNWFWIFFVYHVRLGVVPFFGNGNLFRKKLGPKKFIRDKFGYSTTPRRHLLPPHNSSTKAPRAAKIHRSGRGSARRRASAAEALALAWIQLESADFFKKILVYFMGFNGDSWGSNAANMWY